MDKYHFCQNQEDRDLVDNAVDYNNLDDLVKDVKEYIANNQDAFIERMDIAQNLKIGFINRKTKHMWTISVNKLNKTDKQAYKDIIANKDLTHNLFSKLED